jgi:cyclopropane-fatty-acyl-phospholipid synthase
MGTGLESSSPLHELEIQARQPARPRGPLQAAARGYLERTLSTADIRLDGERQWDPRVRDPRFFTAVLLRGSLGLGESYMDDWWDCEALDQFFCRIFEGGLARQGRRGAPLKALATRLIDRNNLRRSRRVAHQHYDLGNDLFVQMLDTNMQYTCAYWQGAADLDEAQVNKMELICDKLELEKGMRVLELGCGFGTFARFMAAERGCRVTAYNISSRQIAYGRDACRGLPVDIIEGDYRTATGKFDRVVAVGLCEHVGEKHYRELMEVAHRCLGDGGLFLLHTIGNNVPRRTVDPWFDRYVWPNGLIPAISQLAPAWEGLFLVEDLHNFGADYDHTLMAWWRNVEEAWEELPERYDERFRRMWRYYLLSCAAAFRTRELQLWQVVLSKGRRPGVYRSVR